MTDQAFCSKCGSARVPAAAFCATCGRRWDEAPAVPVWPTSTPPAPASGWVVPASEPAPPSSWGADSGNPPKPTSRRKLLIGVVVVGIIAVAALVRGNTVENPNGSGSGSMSDGRMESIMVENLNRFVDSTGAIPRDSSGIPDIAVTDGVLIVVTDAPASADSLCRTVAGMTNDPDTGQPLPIDGVVVINAGAKVTDCRP